MKKIILIISLALVLYYPSPSYAVGEACNTPGQPCGASPSIVCLPNPTGASNPQFTCQDTAAQTGNLGNSFAQNFTSGIPATLGFFVTKLLPQIYIIALILVLIYLTWGAYRYMISGGDPKAIQGAKSHITWAVIGMVIVFLSYGIFQLVNQLLNTVY